MKKYDTMTYLGEKVDNNNNNNNNTEKKRIKVSFFLTYATIPSYIITAILILLKYCVSFFVLFSDKALEHPLKIIL